ncbi:MAG TPA: pyruvate kinase, partial [Chloroflexota bacterium]|nr:pyruvate kinase [Chloroflexota bacterium]
MIPPRRRTKIVGTIGPASNGSERIRELVAAGLDVARLNFSHGTHDEHRAALEMIRIAAREVGRPVGVLQDLQGPKIRTGPIAHPPLRLTAGAPFTITTLPFSGSGQSVSTSFTALPRDVKPGDHILLSDGAVELIVESTTPTQVRTRVLRGGDIGSHTGINLPG